MTFLKFPNILSHTWQNLLLEHSQTQHQLCSQLILPVIFVLILNFIHSFVCLFVYLKQDFSALLFMISLFMKDSVSLRRPGCPETPSVDQAGLKHGAEFLKLFCFHLNLNLKCLALAISKNYIMKQSKVFRISETKIDLIK